MNICLVTPAAPRSRSGNRITALRWARILRELGHRVHIEQEYRGRRCDLMIALHARRSFPSIEQFTNPSRPDVHQGQGTVDPRKHSDAPLIVALTGTDLYADIHTSQEAKRSLEMATRLVVLQPMGVSALPDHVRYKTRVIYQSVKRSQRTLPPRKDVFEICVLGHLREVKDPFRTAMAARLLPASSRIQVIHAGAALTFGLEQRARDEMTCNPRYHWLGELARWKALRILARCRLLVLTSKMEGGANVISEAIAASVPVISSRIPGSIGMLGEDYPGFFPVGDTEALADLLERAETDDDFYQSLKSWCERLAPHVDPARERKSWVSLLHELRR